MPESPTFPRKLCTIQKAVFGLPSICNPFNSLPNHKYLDLSKLKAFADDKTNLTQKRKFVVGRVENIAAKGENAGYQHFLLFP